jgi:hypothetical protein
VANDGWFSSAILPFLCQFKFYITHECGKIAKKSVCQKSIQTIENFSVLAKKKNFA